jgi:hypothetical protein
LVIGISMKLVNFVWFINMKSRVKGDFHARFCENVRVKFPCVTRLAENLKDLTICNKIIKK